MNCQKFQEMLFEYVEGSIALKERAEADVHLARCVECMVAVQREKRLQERLNAGLQRSVESLSLGRQARAQLLTMLTQRESRERSRAQLFAALWVRVASAFGVAAVLALAGVWIWRQAATPSMTQGQIARSVTAESSEPKPTIQIRLPGIATSYTFQQNGEFVVDTFVEQTNFVNVTLWNGVTESTQSKGKERKMPL
jgi:anti-sigma factor RsiW